MSRNDTGVQVISNCASVEQFVARFQRFFDGTSIFIPTAVPVTVGTRDRFSIALTTGEIALSGHGVVIEAQTPAACGGTSRTAGMRVAFEQVDAASQTMFQWLLATRKLSLSTARRPLLVCSTPMERGAGGGSLRLAAVHIAAFAAGLSTAYLVWGSVA